MIGCGYSIVSIFRVRIAFLESKLSKREQVFLILAFVYVALSIVYFSAIFSVQPDPKEPVTMIIHSAPFLNYKVRPFYKKNTS